MNIEEVRLKCLSKHDTVEECTPFSNSGYPDIAFKIAGKIFAFLCIPEGPCCQKVDTPHLLVLKCDPVRALELREKYPRIIEPAWHWNKKYWNQVHYDKLPAALVDRLITESLAEVVKKLPKRKRQELALD